MATPTTARTAPTAPAGAATPAAAAAPGRASAHLTLLPGGAAAGAGPGRAVPPATFRRRRLVVLLVAVLLVATAARAAGAALGGPPLAPSGRRGSVASVTVRPGDTLWGIAARLAPGSDPRPVVDQLEAARHGAPLLAGQVITWQR